jgi:pyruvate/2-oxoglutarate dehydrogenase complex dihydrolipoamide dehydrogenase (E3) component
MPEPIVWDLVVIGGGSAGLVASKTAAGFGARVLLIERERLGGDCLWTGCVPSKALIAAGHRAATVRDASWAGAREPEADAFRSAMTSVQRAINTIAPVDSRDALEAENVSVLMGDARFTSETTLSVDGVEVRFHQALIATGTSPVIPAIAGDVMRMRTSESFWDLGELPERMVVLGGGAIGCELGQAMARLGSQVTIVHRGARILPKEDDDASRIIHTAMLRDGVDVRIGRTAAALRWRDGESGVLSLDDGATIDFDVLVAALGRAPHTDALGLDLAGVRTDADGYVAVDRILRTTNPRIWAAGDVTGLPKFTHTAGANGSVAATNAILGLRRRAETRVIPRVTFTSPEVAAVGLPSSGAQSRGHRVVTWDHAHSDRAIAEDDTVGYTRIVVDRRGTILGGTIVGPRAGETLGELTLAVQARLTTNTIAGTTHAYPTYNDPLWNTAVADVRHRLSRGGIARAIRVLRRIRRRRVA